MTTFGQFALKKIIPGYDVNKPLTKKELSKKLISIASKDPQQYIQVFEQAQEFGNSFSTNEGVTVGLDDITPQYKEREIILNEARQGLSRYKDPTKKINILLKAQKKLQEVSSQHPGEMAAQVRSGGRGSANAFMKAVNSPVVVTDSEDKPRPILIDRGYAEGLTPMQGWIANEEARRNQIKTTTSTSLPGELSKVTASALQNIVVSQEDCNTKNGVTLSASEPSLTGRFVAGTNQLLTPENLRLYKKQNKQITVRSPLTCESHNGVCQKCLGKSLHGGLYDLGENVGVRSATTLAEPMTQMVISAKHGSSVATGSSLVPRGVEAVKQLLEVPKVFKGKATVADISGVVTSINSAPQGGKFLHIDDKKHYIPPGFDVTVKKNQSVKAGDIISDGMPNPQDIIKHKGLGAGREYLVNKLQDVYKDSGFNIDRRHFEVLAKGTMNHVRVLDPGPELPFLPGEVVNYNRLKVELSKNPEYVTPRNAINRTLAKPIGNFMSGTKITNEVLKRLGIKTIPVASKDPKIENIMLPIPRVPLFNPDWLQRLGHREIKSTLQRAAQFGETSKLHGFNPIPAIVTGEMNTDKEAIY